MSVFLLYILVVMSSIKTLFVLISIISILLFVSIGILYLMHFVDSYYIETTNKSKEILKNKLLVSILVLSTLGAVLIPSTKQIAFIYMVPKVLNNEQVVNSSNELIKNLYNLSIEWIDNERKELTKNKQ